MARLTEIAFCLPSTAGSGRFLGDLRSLLAGVAYASYDPAGGLTLTPPEPVGARPVTTLRLSDVPVPQITLDTGHTIGLSGDGPVPYRDELDLADLTERLAGHVTRVDHTGVNMPAGAVSEQQWQSLIQAIGSAATLYRYPTGEQWPFVLPSTPGELQTDIRDFVVGREPRFELVYDEWSPHMTWQFALWTTLTRSDLERLFPAPYGMTLPGLEDIFRTVYVRHPWPDLAIRFDLCYRVDDGPSDWETGEWLVTEGGRIR
jgi:hypothetical protein